MYKVLDKCQAIAGEIRNVWSCSEDRRFEEIKENKMHKKKRVGELIKIRNQLDENNVNQKYEIIDLYKMIGRKLESHNILIMRG